MKKVTIAKSLLQAMVIRLEKEELLTTKQIKQLQITTALAYQDIYEF